MARRRNRSGSVPVSLTRPTIDFVQPRVRLTPLPEIEDRRTFHPLGDSRPLGTFSRRDQRRIVDKSVAVANQYRDPFPSLKLGFAVPEKVAKCVRRKQRREALFAYARTGKGARARRKRDFWSDIRC